MSRPLRITEPGLWHHVMNRGLGKRMTFADDQDRTRFLELVAVCGKRWGLRTFSFCLMPNHYHLFVCDEHGNLSRAMRHLDGVYTQFFNRRHGRDGALFRGRFRDRVVEAETYALEVVRYLHFNPVDAGLVERAADYPWSSHRDYLSARRPEWLHTKEIWDLFGEDTAAGRRRFDEFVHQSADRKIQDAVSAEAWGSLLGSEPFIDAWRVKLRQGRQYTDPELTAAQRLRSWTTDEVIEAACDVFAADRRSIVRGARGKENEPRSLALLVCRDTTPATLTDLGELFHLTPGAISSLAHRIRGRVDGDQASGEAHRRLLDRLSERALAKAKRDPTGIHQFIDRIC